MMMQDEEFRPAPHKFRMLICGIGGAGCRVVSQLEREGLDPQDLMAVHTDTRSLEVCGAGRCLQIGTPIAEGAGTGGDPQKGELCAKHDLDSLMEAFTGHELVVLVTGLGGGTGSGAAPVIARALHEAGMLQLWLTASPFDFEGDIRRHQSRLALRKLREHAEAVVCFPNQRLYEMVNEQAGLEETFAAANHHFTSGLQSLWHLLRNPGFFSIGHSDLKALVSHSNGTASLAAVDVSGENRVENALSGLIGSPLLDGGSVLAKAESVLLGVCSGPEITLRETEHIARKVMSVLRPNVHFFFSVTNQPELAGKLALLVLASEQWIDKPEVQDLPFAENELPEGDAKKSASELVQDEIDLDVRSKGKFKGVDPTIVDGEDLDIPTYIRKSIRLSGQKY